MLSTAEIITEEMRPAWLAKRRNGIGASEAAAAMGLSPYQTPLELYLEKLGLAPDREPNEAMELGLLLEPVLADLFERRTGRRLAERQVFLTSLGFQSINPEIPPFSVPLCATLDARAEDGGIVELKTIGSFPARNLGPEHSDEILEPWLIQAHQQMLLADAPAVDFGVLVGGQTFRLYRVERDERLIDAMLPMLAEFWRRVEHRVPPSPVLPQDASLLRVLRPGADGAVALSPLGASAAEKYFDLGRDITLLTKERERCKAIIENEMAGHAIGLLPDGSHLTRKVIPIKPRVVTLDDVVRSGGVVTIAKGYDRVDLRLKDSPTTTYGGDDL